MPLPVVRPLPGQCIEDIDVGRRIELSQLVAIDKISVGTRGVEQPGRNRAAGCGVMPEDRTKGNYAGAAGQEKQRPPIRLSPHEVSANGTPELELVPGTKLVEEIRRYLPLLEPLNGKHQVRILRGRRDRIASLGLVSVLCRQPNIDVLPSLVTRPAGTPKDQAPHSRGFVDSFNQV